MRFVIYEVSGFLQVQFLVVEPRNQVCFSEHLELFSIHLNLTSSKLWQKNLVTHSYTHGDSDSSITSCSRSNCYNCSFILFSLSLLWDQESSFGLCFNSSSLKRRLHQEHNLYKKQAKKAYQSRFISILLIVNLS